MNLKDLKKVQLNGSAYIGKLEDDGKHSRKITNAVPLSGDFKQSVRNWIKADSAGKLQEINDINDQNATASSNFTGDDLLIIDIELSKFKFAKSNATPDLINRYYDNMS